MAGQGGISGVAVGTTVAGAFLLWTGIRNVPITEGLRDLVRGRVPTEGAQVSAAGATAAGIAVGVAQQIGGNSGGAILTQARAQIGKPYVWGTEGPNTFDCSGLVHWSLNHAGIKAPRLTAAGYMAWSGAVTVPRATMQPGDLVCWGGHIGIAASDTTMIEAANRSVPVREGKIWAAPPPVIRRVKASPLAISSARQAQAQLRRLG